MIDQPLKNALTIDVEDYFQVGVFQSKIAADEWDGFECRVERNLDLILEILAGADVKATFFVLGWIAERYPAAIRRLAEEGHEVGSHGQGHQPIWKLDPKAFREDIRRSQSALGEVLGKTPEIYRAPCFSVTHKTLWALQILHDEGIRRDSSIFPVHHPEYGIPGAEPGIHHIELPDGGLLEEFPMTVSRVAGASLAVCGGGWFRLFPYRVTRRLLQQSVRAGRPFVFYLHPWELDPDQPRLAERASMSGRFRHYLNLKRTEDRFRRLIQDFDFGTMAEVLDAEPRRVGALPRVRY